jgi:hypothetical protein
MDGRSGRLRTAPACLGVVLVLRLAIALQGLPVEAEGQCSMGMAIFYRCVALQHRTLRRASQLDSPSVSGKTGAVAIADVGRNELQVTAIIALQCYAAVIIMIRKKLQVKIEQVDDDEVVSRKAGVAIPAANRAARQRWQIQGAAERKRIVRSGPKPPADNYNSAKVVG